jgi:hypothetical protein
MPYLSFMSIQKKEKVLLKREIFLVRAYRQRNDWQNKCGCTFGCLDGFFSMHGIYDTHTIW